MKGSFLEERGTDQNCDDYSTDNGKDTEEFTTHIKLRGRSIYMVHASSSTVKGFAEHLSAVVYHELRDISRFENPKSLVAFAGLDPRIKQSGEKLIRQVVLPSVALSI